MTRASGADIFLCRVFRNLLEAFLSKTASFWIGMGVAAAIVAPAAAQQAPSAAPDPAHVRELIRQAAQQAQPQSQSPAGAPTAVFVTAGPRVNLTIEDAVQRGDGQEHRHCRRAHHAAADRLLHRGARGELPAEPDVGGEQHEQQPPCRSRPRRASPRRRPASATSWSAGIAQNLCQRRRQLQRQLDQQPPEQPEHGQPPQPAVHNPA